MRVKIYDRNRINPKNLTERFLFKPEMERDVPFAIYSPVLLELVNGSNIMGLQQRNYNVLGWYNSIEEFHLKDSVYVSAEPGCVFVNRIAMTNTGFYDDVVVYKHAVIFEPKDETKYDDMYIRQLLSYYFSKYLPNKYLFVQNIVRELFVGIKHNAAEYDEYLQNIRKVVNMLINDHKLHIIALLIEILNFDNCDRNALMELYNIIQPYSYRLNNHFKKLDDYLNG